MLRSATLQTQVSNGRLRTRLLAFLAIVGVCDHADAQVVPQIQVPAGPGKLTPAVPILGDVFGTRLDVDGPVLVAGGLGAVWVFEDMGGLWQQTARLTASSASLNFGCAVAVDGDRILVGDTGDDGVPVTAHVFVFERDLAGWVLTAMLPDATGKNPFDSFGASLELHNDTAVVGSKHIGGSLGGAFIYHFDGVQWNEQAAFLAPSPRPGAVFGTAVAVHADRVAIGAPGDPLEQVIIYTRFGNLWSPTQALSEANTSGMPVESGFGASVALGPTTVIIGMPNNDSVGINAGSIAAFEDPGTGFQFDQTFTPSDLAAGDRFGLSVSLDADHVLVGSPFSDVAGSAYLFTRCPVIGFIEDARFTPADGQAGDQFGTAVAVSGTTAAFGAPFNPEAGSWVGAVYTWNLNGGPCPSPVGTSLCFGDGGNQAGCTNCPCFNNAPVGSGGGCLNSAGTSAQLNASGSASVSLPNMDTTDLRFALTGAPSNAFCILNSGDGVAPNNPMNPCFGMQSGVQAMAFDGLRCAIGNERRQGGRSADANGDVGVTNNPWGGEGGPPAGIAQAGGGFAAGQTRFFAVVYRDDPLQACQRGLNTSQAQQITFTP